MMNSDFLSVIVPLIIHMAVYTVIGAFLKTSDATTTTVVAAAVVIPIALWLRHKDIKSEKKESEQSLVNQISFGIICFLAGAVLNILWSRVLHILNIQALFSNRIQEELLSGRFIIQLIGLGFMIPLSEELVFRGLIHQRLKKLFPVKGAIIFSSLIFAVYHGNPIQMLFSFPMSVVLATVYEKGGLLIYPILFHMGSNLIAVFMQAM